MNISDDVLMHKQGFAYLKRWWKNGHWNYEYEQARNDRNLYTVRAGAARYNQNKYLERARDSERMARLSKPEKRAAYQNEAVQARIDSTRARISAEDYDKKISEAEKRMKETKPTLSKIVKDAAAAIKTAIALEKAESASQKELKRRRGSDIVDSMWLVNRKIRADFHEPTIK